MLADGVEASVRSLASRDEPAIRSMVARIISDRMEDGQFDECDLTLRDISRAQEAFVAQLLGMYHQRVAYPRARSSRSNRAAPRAGAAAARVTRAERHLPADTSPSIEIRTDRLILRPMPPDAAARLPQAIARPASERPRRVARRGVARSRTSSS